MHLMQLLVIDENCPNFKADKENSIIISSDNVLVACSANETLTVPPETVVLAKDLCLKISTIKYVIFEGDKVERIEKQAFIETGLEAITLPPNIQYLGASIFEGTPLTSIVIPKSLLSADDEVFAGSSLETVTVVDGCKGMVQDSNLVVFNSNLDVILFIPIKVEALNITRKVSTIGNTTLQKSSKMTKLFVDENHLEFNEYDNALYSSDKKYLLACPGGIKTIHIASECIQLCGNAFSGIDIEEVIFNGIKVAVIEVNCFTNCKMLTKIELPASLETLGIMSFYRSSLEGLSFKFPPGFKELKDNSIQNTLIQEVDFSACVNKVTMLSYALCNNNKLTSVILPPDIDIISPISLSNTYITSIIITSNVQEIHSSAFQNCIHLKNVTFETNVLTFIGGNAFSGTSIEEISLPDSVTELDSYSFSLCSNLSLFSISPNSKLQSLSTYVFYGCSSLKSLYLGKYVDDVKPRALTGTYGLMSINVSKENSKYSSDGVLLLSKNGDILFACPGGIEEIKVVESVKEIYDSAFFNCINLKKVSFAISSDRSGLEKIGESTFSGCTQLSIISIPESLSNLSSNAFEGCFNLSTVIFADNSRLKTIASGVFTACEKLSVVAFGNGSQLSEIGIGAFKKCYSLTSFDFPPNIQIISDSAFEDCRSIESIEVPNGTLMIGSNAFKGCSNCVSFILPSSLRNISAGALSDCPNIKSIVYCGLKCFSGIDILGNTKLNVTVKMFYKSDLFGQSSVEKVLDGNCNFPTFRFTMLDLNCKPSLIAVTMSEVVCYDGIEGGKFLF